jgi:hypothetical protein
MNSFSILEKTIATNIKQQLDPIQLTKALAKMPTGFAWLGQYIVIKELDLRITDIAFQSSWIKVSIDFSSKIFLSHAVSVDTKKQVTYTGVSMRPKTTLISVDETDLMAITPFLVDKINVAVDQKLLRITSIGFSFAPHLLSAIIIPEGFLENGIKADFSIKYDPQNRSLLLEEMNLASNSQTNLIFRTILKLLHSRIESKVQNHFPIDLKQLAEVITDNIEEINKQESLPFRILLQELDFHDIVLRQSSILLRLSYSLAFSSKDLQHLIE